MADISAEITEIQEASYGSEVRQSIVDGLNKVNAGTLPAVSVSDAGKFLKVNNDGEWEVGSGGLIPTPTGTKNITENGTHDVTNYASANVDVEPDLGTKNITQNGTYNALSDDLDGYSSVVVDVQGGGGGTIEPLSVTQNGTYTPPSGVDGYAPVIVNVSGGGGGKIDYSLLPQSNASKVLASNKDYFSALHNNEYGFLSSWHDYFYTELSETNSDVTAYCVVRCLDTRGGILISVPYNLSDGNDPSFYTPSESYGIDCTVYNGNTNIPGLSCAVDHVYALAIDSANRKCRYYYDGVYFTEKTFSNSGNHVSFGKGNNDKYNMTFMSSSYISYAGVVEEFESDSVIIANMQKLMTEFGIGT